MIKLYLVVMLLLLQGVEYTEAQKILSFDMVEMQTGNEATVHSNYNDLNLNPSLMTRGPGISFLDANWINATGGDLDPGLFNSYNWTTNSFIDLNDYIEFTITPNFGYQFSIRSIVIQHEKEANGPTNFVLRTSADAFTTNLGEVYTIPIVRSRPIVANINLALIDISEAITLRLYGYGANDSYATWGLGIGTHDPLDPPVSADHIVVNGFVIPENSPSIFTSVISLNDHSYFLGSGPSSSKQFDLIGSNLSPLNGNLTVNGTTNYEVSLDNTNFSSSVLVPYSGGSLSTTSVFTRLKSGLLPNSYNNENILITGGGATQKQINCSGFVSAYNLVINEILSDGDNIDANFDGVANYVNDQFIELVNIGATNIDLTNFTIADAIPGPQIIRHTFTPVILPIGEAIVVFGGGNISNFNISLVQKASNFRLSLDDAGDKVILSDNTGKRVAVYQYGNEGATDQSLARNPDYTGPFVKHSTIITNPNLFSAGKRNTDASPLPVELSSFSAVVLKDKIKLSWKTDTEVNNYGFEVERSGSQNVNGQVWARIGFVNGNGNSNSPKNYIFEDENIEAGQYCYRLKQIDNDGKYNYSQTIEVDLNVPSKFELSQNYPNPFNPVTTIKFSLPIAGAVKLTVFNLLGEEITTLINENMEEGVHTINFNASNYNSGLYIYKIEAIGIVQSRKMILLK